MSQVIAYSNAQGGVVIVNPAPGIDPSTIMSVVPQGVTGYIIDQSSLPASSQGTWVLDSTGKITTAAFVPTADLVNAERDRRLLGGFMYLGVPYQTDETSIDNILGAAQLGYMAIVAGAQQGDMMWSGSTAPFEWIAMNNSFVQMDAATVVTFAKAAASFRQTITIAARLLKNAIAAGQTPDIYADTSWGQDSTSPTSTSATDPSGAAPAASSTTTPSTASTTATAAS